MRESMRKSAAADRSPLVRLARSGRELAACCLVAVVVVCVLGGGAALAATGHDFLSSVSEAPPGTPLTMPSAMAVDGLTGEVFVGDSQVGYVDVYSATGGYETRFGEGMIDASGLAVDEANGYVYVADAFMDALMVFKPDGSGGYVLVSQWFGEGLTSGEFGAVRGVAVDNSQGPSAGRVYVVDSRDPKLLEGVVDVFEPRPRGPEEGREGSLVRVLGAGKLEDPNGVAVSPSTGRVLVADSVKGVVDAFSAEGVFEEKLTGKGSPYGAFAKEATVGDVSSVGVDGVTGDVYVAEAERHAVSEYSAAGEWEGWITTTPAGGLGEPRGVALNGAGEVFVADAGLGVVDRFDASAVVPSVETGKVAKSGLTRTAALLSGTVDGEGKAATYRFQYGETPALGSETAAGSSGAGVQEVSATAEPLLAGRDYYYRIVAEDEDGVNYGLLREFKTSPAVTGLTTGLVESVEPEGATLTGSLKREGLETHYYFQYGTSEAYSQQTPLVEVPAGAQEKEEKQERTVQANVKGLDPNTLYHYRVVAKNEYGATYGRDRTFTTSGPPRIAYEPVSAISQTEATIHAGVYPDQIDTHYHFEYGETTAYGAEAPAGGQDIGSGASPVAVSATLPGLKVGATYHFRVVAQNAAGVSYGEDQTFTTVPSAPVDGTFATAVTASQATLHAEINPLGHDTHYYFQYGTQDCQANPAACKSLPDPPGVDIGEGAIDVAGEVEISGLTPGTTYHYRVLDSNELGMTVGPEHTFSTQEERVFALADSRAWEMVSPPNKQGAAVEALTREGGIILSAEDGDSLTYVVKGALDENAEGNRSPEWQQVIARREPGGWHSEDIATPSSKAKGVVPGATPEYQYFAPNLSTALVQPPGGSSTQAEPPLAEGVKQATMYLRDNATGTYLPLVTEANVAPGVTFGNQLNFVTATPDLSHVIFNSGVALNGPSSAAGLYEWAHGALSLVGVRRNGRPAGGLVELGYSHTTAGAVSNDGSRIVWTTVEEEPKLGHLYLRDTRRDETVQVDAAEGTAEPAVGMARFQGASGDGSRIFFTDRQRLTMDATAEPATNEQEPYGEPDLYVCEVAVVDGRIACHVKDLTIDYTKGAHADVQGAVLGMNQEGTSVYVVARGVLAANESGNHEHAIDRGDNLYELHFDGTQWSTTFIATLSREDSPEWEANQLANTAYLTARVSPNGRYLAFMSSAPLTGYDNIDANPEAKSARDEEVFLYDSQAASLRCVSCNPSGARPEGVLDTEGVGEGLGLLVDRRKVWFGHWLAGNVPGWTAENLTSALIQSRYLSDDGRLFFNSPDDLVSAAINHKEDVYEYEPSGVGGCVSPTGGCVSLISGGGSDRESAFIEATPDGSDVFFVTAAQLLPQDTDTAFDIYDARECTADSPCLTRPGEGEAPCTETGTCRPAGPARQIPGGPAGTASFSGPGNVLSRSPAAKHGVEAKRAVKPVLQAQLTRALRSCRKRYAHSTKRRVACEREARKRYREKRAAANRAKPKVKAHGEGGRRR